MKYGLINFLMFTAGAAVGSVVTWKFVKSRYEQIAQEEIDSVKEVFANRAKEEGDEETYARITKPGETSTKEEMMEYAKILSEEQYTNYSEMHKEPEKIKKKNENGQHFGPELKEGQEEVDEEPYVISPDDYGEFDNYEQRNLTYYAGDNVLVDENEEVINEDDADALVGLSNLKRFGEYEADSVHVRDDVLRTDYEILLDLRNSSEVDVYYPHSSGS